MYIWSKQIAFKYAVNTVTRFGHSMEYLLVEATNSGCVVGIGWAWTTLETKYQSSFENEFAKNEYFRNMLEYYIPSF